MALPQPVTAPSPAWIDLGRFEATPLVTQPFSYLIVPGFVSAESCRRINADYPPIKKRGSFSLDTLTYGPAFSQLLDDLRGDAFRAAVEQKFGISLAGRPTMITVRGMSGGRRDGHIHTDTENKIITLLLYMNDSWDNDGGRLRLLNSPRLDDVAAEVPPEAGTLLAFKRSDNSWHGHKPFTGERKVIQMNWVTDQGFADRNHARHRWSALLKKLNPFGQDY
ncbi:MAG: 2OG-Fe(II) oxygenase [Pseudomonadota bacterium]|nr:2OG-Fe(II) oxygenase [Pseudomonadota bacterium]